MKHKNLLTILLFMTAAMTSHAQMARLYTSESGLANTQINSTYQDSKGFIWICTENGLSRFDGMDFSTFRFERDKPSSIASNMVRTTYEDSDNVFWVGTSAGLQIFDPEYNTFTKIALQDDSVPDSEQHISSIVEVKYKGEERILVTTSGHGVYAFDKDTRKLDHMLMHWINSNLPSEFIYMTYLDSKERLWICLEDGGLMMLDITEENSRNDIWGPGMEDIEKDMFQTLAEDRETGKVMIGSFDNGILIFEEETG